MADKVPISPGRSMSQLGVENLSFAPATPPRSPAPVPSITQQRVGVRFARSFEATGAQGIHDDGKSKPLATSMSLVTAEEYQETTVGAEDIQGKPLQTKVHETMNKS